MEVEQCVLCQTETKESLSSVKSGITNLIQYAKDFWEIALENHLVAIQNKRETNTENASEVKIHRSCQKAMSNEMQKRLQSEKSGVPPAKKAKIMTRSSLDHFDWKTNCLFCGKTCIIDEKHPEKGKDVHHAKYKEYCDIVLKQCKEIDDEQARLTEHRVRIISDFVAKEARYHNTCLNLFNLKVKTKTLAQGMKGRQ